ncbi:MAG: hypothetical protein ABI662_12860 [Dermatophilaceae bacterium]
MILETEPVVLAVVAAFSAFGVAALSIVPAVLAARRGREAREAIGTPNGHGTVSEMGAKAIDAIEDVRSTLANVDGRLLRTEERHDARMDRIESRLDRHIATCQAVQASPGIAD